MRDLVGICTTKQSVLRRADGEVGDAASPTLDGVAVGGLYVGVVQVSANEVVA